MSNAEGTTHTRVRWQFTLRTVLIGITAFCAVLGLGAWKGAVWAIGGLVIVSSCLVAIAIHSRRKRRIVCSMLCLLAALSAGGLYFFGSRSVVVSLCPVCGKERVVESFLGVTWRDRECDGELSRWYRHMKLKPHVHRWVHLCSTYQYWGGQKTHFDSFGFELIPLRLLKQASEQVDRATLEDLAQDYYAAREDPTKIAGFVNRCEEIVPDEDWPESDP